MSVDFSNVKKISVKLEGALKELKQIANKSAPGVPVIWKGTWKYTINLGLYVSKVKYSVDNVNWTSITSATTVEVDSEATLYIKAETYSSEARTYQYSYTMTDYNFNITRTEANDGGSVTVYRTATPVVNTYSISGTYTNGSLKYYKESAHTTVITSAKYGDTVYYVGTPNTGYSGGVSGSIVVNESNMTLDKNNLTATKNYGSASRIYYTVTWKWQSSYGTWTTTTQSYEYGATPSRTSPGTVTSGNTRQVFSRWDDLSPLYSDRTITAVYYTQYNITVESTRCTADKSSGWTTYGTVITWTAGTDYSFAEGTTRTATTTSTVTGEGTYSKSANYYNITVSGTNCSANVATGYRLIGATITWTANHSSGNYYSFSNTSYTKTSTATIAVGTQNYSKTANYIYYYIVVSYDIGCHVSANGTGYYLKDASITSTWEVDNANTLTFDSSQTTSITTTTKTWTSTNDGYVTSPRVYTRLYTVTFSGTYGSWSTASMKVPYNTSVSKSGLVVTVGDSTSTFTKNSDTAQYSYSNASVGTVPSKITSNTTITGTATRTLRSYAVSITAGTGVGSVYLSTNSSATSGDASGTVYNYGTTVYAFIKVNDGYYSTDAYVGGGSQYEANACYRVGSVTVDGTENFGTVNATRNPKITLDYEWGSSYIDNVSTAEVYVKYGSTHTIRYDCAPGYYLEGDYWTTKTNSITVNNITKYATGIYTLAITSDTLIEPEYIQYYSWSINVNNFPWSGSVSFSNGESKSYSWNSNSTTIYYTGNITLNITIRSIEVYGSTGEKTNYNKLFRIDRYPFAYNNSDDRVITSVSGTYDSVEELRNWLGTGTGYHQVTINNTYSPSDRSTTVSGVDSASAYISGATSKGAVYAYSNDTLDKKLNASSDYLVLINYGYRQSGRLAIGQPSKYAVSPSTFYFGDGSQSPRTVNVTYSQPSWTITILGSEQSFVVGQGTNVKIIYYTSTSASSYTTVNITPTSRVTITGVGNLFVRDNSGETKVVTFDRGYVYSSCIQDEWASVEKYKYQARAGYVTGVYLAPVSGSTYTVYS